MSDFWSNLVEPATGRIGGVMPAGTRFAPIPSAELSAPANLAVEATEPEPRPLEIVDWPSLVPQDRVTAPLPTLHQLALNVAIVEPLQPVVQEADSILPIDEIEAELFPSSMPDPLPIVAPGLSDNPAPTPPLEAPSSIADNQTSRAEGSVIRRPSDQSVAGERLPLTHETPQSAPNVGEDRPETGPPESQASNEPNFFPGRPLAPAVDSMKSNLGGEDSNLIQQRTVSSPTAPGAPVVTPPIPSEPAQVASIQPAQAATESVSARLELENVPEPAISSSSAVTTDSRCSVQASEPDTRITPSLPPAARSQPDVTGPPASHTPADFPPATGAVEQHVITPPEVTTDASTAVETAAAQPMAAQSLTSRVEPGPTTIPPSPTEAAAPATNLPTVPAIAPAAQTAAESQIAPLDWPGEENVPHRMSTPTIPAIEPPGTPDAPPGLVTVEPAVASMIPSEAVTYKPTVQSDAPQRNRDRRDPLPVATNTRQTTAQPELNSQVLPPVAAAAVDESVINLVEALLIAPDLPLQPSKGAGISSVEPVVMPQPALSDRQVTPLVAAPTPVTRVPPPRPTIRVTIGQVEVRTRAEPPPPPVRLRTRPKPAISLDDYLRGGSR